MKKNNLIGRTYGKLTVVAECKERKNQKIVWQCKCECGNTSYVTSSDLTTGNTISCGCMSSRHKAGDRTRTHSMSKTKIYSVWRAMLNRCYNQNQKSYKDYGAKGIKVCDSWHQFENFYKDMGAHYREGLTIERIDSTNDYCPANCKWITKAEQARNKSDNCIVTYRGETGPLMTICKKYGLHYQAIKMRIWTGWDKEKALTTPIKTKKS